jgi:hypothetical protein
MPMAMRLQPGTPKVDIAIYNNYPKNRLGLSEWLFDKRNPLTARFCEPGLAGVFWQGHPKKFRRFWYAGRTAQHPELLDWLAVDFMKHGWDMKRLVKQMVMSATYRQSAVVTR